MRAVHDRYRDDAIAVSRLDGLSMEFPRWRFNLRCSNTEPLLRLNLETRADPQLLRDCTGLLLEQIGGA
jgi:phosphomannomutase